MGFWSSLFGAEDAKKPQFTAVGLAERCAKVRIETGHKAFLHYYLSNRSESAADLMRFNFSKDVLMIHLSSALTMDPHHDHDSVMAFNERARNHYLSIVTLPTESIVSDCVICDEELAALKQFIAPDATDSVIRTSRVSTAGLVLLLADYRAHQFRKDFLQGMIDSPGGFGLFNHVAKSYLRQVRGDSGPSVSEDDSSYLSVAISNAWRPILNYAFESGYLRK